jgi:hypothetical protein
MQWMRLKYEDDEKIDKKNTLSFTLCLELPESGGGLYTFDSSSNPILTTFIPRSCIHSFAKKEKILYKVGYMVTHNGQTYHMIAPSQKSNKKRITLQGHGVYDKNKDTWYLYW